MSGRDKWVRRFSVDETARHKNGFTIYKITSVLFPLTSPEAGTIVSVWKRFSEVQRLRRGMRALHVGLGLPGDCPKLPTRSFFKRFDAEVLQERCEAIKQLLEFIAEHRLLFASTEFVNFLQTGYAEPAGRPPGVINEIRSALHLPIEDTPPLEYQTDDEDRSPGREDTHDTTDGAAADQATTRVPIDVSDIQIFEAADVDMRKTPETKNTDSSESLNSLESIKSDLFEEVNRMTIDKPKTFVKKKSVLPDLIDFDEPSTSQFDDYHTMRRTSSDAVSLSSSYYDGAESTRSQSRVSQCSQLGPSESYVFEAGLVLQQAARCERAGDFPGAFRLYKCGIQVMLRGVHSDNEPQRRALVRQKTETYLAHAETLYNNHIAGADVAPPPPPLRASLLAPLPAHLLRREYEELGQYRLLAVLQGKLMLVLHRGDQTRHVIKVIQKIPNNLTEFDEFFHHRPNETKQVILPTNIPFMVALNCYIETPNLIFLVLEYAPGQKLFEYIRNYVKSVPNTPARELNLENIFVDPQKTKLGDIQNRNDGVTVDAKAVLDSENSIVDRLGTSRNNNGEDEKVTQKTENLDDSEISVNELVINSQRLLLNVSKVLNEEPKTVVKENESNVKGVMTDNMQIDVVDKAVTNVRHEGKKAEDIPEHKITLVPRGRDALPPSAVCRWAAQLLTALDCLHNCGLVCRDLNPSNILLGKRGQILLTYCCGYPPGELPPPPVPRGGGPPPPHVAPELYAAWGPAGGEVAEGVCDFWSFGAILYELICGVRPAGAPLSPHSLPRVPPGLPVDAESLLAQLLCPIPSERLGARGIGEIKEHPYFKNIDWQEVYDSWLMPD